MIRKRHPKCIFCDETTIPTVVYRDGGIIISGWRCPRCGFTMIHPKHIQRALNILRETAKVLK